MKNTIALLNILLFFLVLEVIASIGGSIAIIVVAVNSKKLLNILWIVPILFHLIFVFMIMTTVSGAIDEHKSLEARLLQMRKMNEAMETKGIMGERKIKGIKLSVKKSETKVEPDSKSTEETSKLAVVHKNSYQVTSSKFIVDEKEYDFNLIHDISISGKEFQFSYNDETMIIQCESYPEARELYNKLWVKINND